MAKGISLHLGLNSVNPNFYSGWSGDLNACENDALDMNAIAIAQGFNTKVLLTKQVTRNVVINEITNAAKQLIGGDTFLISYSGHGGQIPDLDGDEDDGMDETWCFYDGQIIDDELNNLWGEFKRGVKLLIISDSCNSGSVAKILPSFISHQSIIMEKKIKAMPTEVAQSVYLRNKKKYDAIIKKMNATALKQKALPNQYDGLLISGAQDGHYSYDGAFNGAFTGELKNVWNGGKFSGTYREFYNKITNRLSNQTPNYFLFGSEQDVFAGLRPFTI